MALLGSLLVKINGDNSGLDKSVDGSEKSVKKFSKFAVASYAAVGVAVVALAKKSVQAYAVQEKAEAALKAAIKATGKESQISFARMKTYASSLQEVTLFGDEATLSGLALLQSLADLTEKGLKEVTPGILDFATATGMNLDAAMSLVGKTLGSSTNALARYGIEIDTSGTKSEKLAEITDQLKGKFGGAAQAAASTSSGALTQMWNAVGDLSEVFGKLTLDKIQPFVQWVTAASNALIDFSNKQQLASVNQEIAELDIRIKSLQKGSIASQGKGILGMKREDINADAATIKKLQTELTALQNKKTEMVDGKIDEIIPPAIGENAGNVNDELKTMEEEFGVLFPMTDEFWNHNRSGAIDLGKEVEVVNETYKTLATDGLSAFATTFKQVGDGSISILEGMKEAVKNTISAELEGLARIALVRAGIAAATFRFGTAAKLAGAATLAFAASGFVQTLAEGGVLAPATGGTPAIMAEAGVPEMAMPLNSNATDPFADKIASRINSNTTNNNTQNFNSMFSLNDDNQMREAARRLFPYMIGQEQRRGM